MPVGFTWQSLPTSVKWLSPGRMGLSPRHAPVLRPRRTPGHLTGRTDPGWRATRPWRHTNTAPHHTWHGASHWCWPSTGDGRVRRWLRCSCYARSLFVGKKYGSANCWGCPARPIYINDVQKRLGSLFKQTFEKWARFHHPRYLFYILSERVLPRQRGVIRRRGCGCLCVCSFTQKS